MPKKEDEEIRDTEAYVNDLRKDMDKRLSELKVELDDLQQKAVKTVSEQPMLALGVAFVAGMALGIALSQSGD